MDLSDVDLAGHGCGDEGSAVLAHERDRLFRFGLKVFKYLQFGFKLLDDLIGKANTAIALMREHRTALISAAVTGKIDVREAHQAAHA